MRVLTIVLVAVGVLAAIVIARFILSANAGAAQDKAMTAAFVPDPHNTTVLVVRGWSRQELDRILSDFLQGYDLPKTSAPAIAARPGDTFAMTFPNDIQPKLLLFLVNYLQYPKDIDLEHRSIAVLCHVTLTPAFGAPDPALAGKRADIYVPANDADFDLVYAKVETGAVYRISFTDLIWNPESDARMPAGVAGL